MAKRPSDEQLREWQALGFSAEDIAHLARPTPLSEIEARLAALARPDPKQAAAQSLALRRQEKQAVRARILACQRPFPPEEFAELSDAPLFLPASELCAWIYKTFVEVGGLLCNEDHAHLLDAQIGMLWTNVPNSRGGNAIAGQAEIPQAQGGRWAKAKYEYQLCQWFGAVPDFLITLDADYAVQCEDVAFCALVEHELYHCAQALDAFGAPKFSKSTGLPIFRIKGHDVEEFVPIVRRYGPGAAAGQTAALVAAAQQAPLIGNARIAAACGTCRR